MQKCEKFKVGETLKSDIGRKLNMMVDRINRDIKGDGKSIIVTEFGNAITISAVRRGGGGGGGGGGSSAYDGYFKVVKASDTTVSVIDGAAPASSTCGYYEHGIQRVAVTKPSAITVSATGFIYVTITYTTVYVFTFAFGTTLPASANGSIVRKIADVTFADGKITAITQAQQGILITAGVL
jgi:hypothetical protein